MSFKKTEFLPHNPVRPRHESEETLPSTTRRAQSYIARLPTTISRPIGDAPLADLTIGDAEQVTLLDFKEEVFLELVNRSNDPPTKVMAWLKKGDIDMLVEWLRTWQRES